MNRCPNGLYEGNGPAYHPGTMQLPECYASAVSLFNGMVRADRVFYTMSGQLVVRYEELRRDIAHFLSLPIPQVVCERMKVFQNDALVQFILNSAVER